MIGERPAAASAAPGHASGRDRFPVVAALALLGVSGAAIVAGALSVGAGWVAPGQWLGEPSLARDLVWTWRAPRVAAAFFVGACLAVAGMLFQAVFRNPLAEPYLLGSASGAAVGAAIALLVPQVLPAPFALPLFAFAGAWGASWLVLAIGSLGGAIHPARLLLAGVALAAILSAVRGLLLMLFGDESANLRAIVSWQLGGVQTPTHAELLAFLPLLAAIWLGARALAPGLDALGLGEATAQSLGHRVPRLVATAVLLAALATALAVTWGGLIGFVGLIVPHVMRWWIGPLHRRLLPATILGGGIMLVAVDALARAALPPSEIPVGLITALVGGPFFIALLFARRG